MEGGDGGGGGAPPSDQLENLTVSSTEEPAPTSSSSSAIPQLMSPEERFRIVRSVGEECIQEDELLNLLTKKPQPICYDGFEPSGRMHIAQMPPFSSQLGMLLV
ncbi:hypothetical protein MLD38_008123 [Melastoma candidum]|uniref:Uncharacterized protein n=1 Tax=Melastoma candidum TaxID=119954 RepID=A0ACB9RV66_9MYRT|nr:hypothetical protein MLD38_008123 [Melastoma candidum]